MVVSYASTRGERKAVGVRRQRCKALGEMKNFLKKFLTKLAGYGKIFKHKRSAESEDESSHGSLEIK